MTNKFIYEIRTNNLCYGNLLLNTYNNKYDALYDLNKLQQKYGCCVVKKVKA